MKTNTTNTQQPVRYFRLLSYDNACKVIEFIIKNDKDDYAHITPGGVATEVKEENWPKVIDYVKSLDCRCEVTLEHPEKINEKIVRDLKEAGII